VDQPRFNHLIGGNGSVYGGGHCRIPLLDAGTNFLQVFNMSATMAKQGGRVQLDQSNMHLALNMAKMAKGGFSCAAREETQYPIKKPQAEVREEKKQGVEFPRHKKVKAVMERHLAIIHHNHMDSFLPCQNGSAQNPQTLWRCKETGAPQPVRRGHPTPDLMPSPPGTPPAPPGPIQVTQRLQPDNLPAANADSCVPLPVTQPVNLDAFAEDSILDEDFDPELLTDERTSCG